MNEFRGDNRVPFDIPVNFDKTMGEILREWRKFRGLSMRRLADQINPPINRGHISKMENNKISRPSDELLRAISEALSISPGYLLLRRGPDEAFFK